MNYTPYELFAKRVKRVIINLNEPIKQGLVAFEDSEQYLQFSVLKASSEIYLEGLAMEYESVMFFDAKNIAAEYNPKKKKEIKEAYEREHLQELLDMLCKENGIKKEEPQ